MGFFVLCLLARSCSVLILHGKWRKQRKEQSHAQCHVTQRIRIFDKISENVQVTKSLYQRFPYTVYYAVVRQETHHSVKKVKNCVLYYFCANQGFFKTQISFFFNGSVEIIRFTLVNAYWIAN